MPKYLDLSAHCKVPLTGGLCESVSANSAPVSDKVLTPATAPEDFTKILKEIEEERS